MKRCAFFISQIFCSFTLLTAAPLSTIKPESQSVEKKESIEHTLAMLKPDAISANHIGEIIARFEKGGLKVIGAKMVKLTKPQAERFYRAHTGKPYFSGLITYITSGPVVALALEGKNAITLSRDLIGATDPKKAVPGTIRADFGTSIQANAIHGSDSLETALIEVSFFFNEMELFPR